MHANVKWSVCTTGWWNRADFRNPCDGTCNVSSMRSCAFCRKYIFRWMIRRGTLCSTDSLGLMNSGWNGLNQLHVSEWIYDSSTEMAISSDFIISNVMLSTTESDLKYCFQRKEVYLDRSRAKSFNTRWATRLPMLKLESFLGLLGTWWRLLVVQQWLSQLSRTGPHQWISSEKKCAWKLPRGIWWYRYYASEHLLRFFVWMVCFWGPNTSSPGP